MKEATNFYKAIVPLKTSVKKITCPKKKDPFEKVGHDHRIKQ